MMLLQGRDLPPARPIARTDLPMAQHKSPPPDIISITFTEPDDATGKDPCSLSCGMYLSLKLFSRLLNLSSLTV